MSSCPLAHNLTDAWVESIFEQWELEWRCERRADEMRQEAKDLARRRGGKADALAQRACATFIYSVLDDVYKRRDLLMQVCLDTKHKKYEWARACHLPWSKQTAKVVR